MSDAVNSPAGDKQLKAVKDKQCPFCGQAFTSSSLGRHLDLFIREKNPKEPDGIHDVDEIRKVRGSVTRRQPRGGILLRRDISTSTGTPTARSRRSITTEDVDNSNHLSPSTQHDGLLSADAVQSQFPFIHPWEASGVIRNLPPKSGESDRTADAEGGQAPNVDAGRRPVAPQRVASRQALKAQLDGKQKMQEALDTARAAELALREMVGSMRAAKQQIDMTSMPFDFDPLSLDFPALTLQCLQPPPTLFSSTQHSTPTSWSIISPGGAQFKALQAYFKEEFRKWKITCAAATTAVYEELTYPPSNMAHKHDVREAVRRAEKTADALERQVTEHLASAFVVWDKLSEQRRNELWVLELARSVGKKQKELDQLKDSQHTLKQENANLRAQIDHLNRLQQPREFKILSPTTIPFDRKLVAYLQERGVVDGRRNVGMNIDDRHSDLNTIISSAIDRWKTVIVTARSGAAGMNAQRSLDQPASPAFPAFPVAASTPVSAPVAGGAGAAGASVSTPVRHFVQPQQQSQQTVPTLQSPPQPRNIGAATNPSSLRAPNVDVTTTTNDQDSDMSPLAESSGAAPSADENSDLDADAEMDDDDGFSALHTPITNAPNAIAPAAPQQQVPHLEVARTRGAGAGAGAAGNQAQPQAQARFVNGSNAAGGGLSHNTRSVSHAAGRRRGGSGGGNMGRSVTGVNTMHVAQQQGALQHHSQHGQMAIADMGLMQGVGGHGGDAMLMD